MKWFSRWLYKKTHAVELSRLDSDIRHAKSLGVSKREGMAVALVFLGLR